MSRDPCPYCGMPGISLGSRDGMTGELVHDIKEHTCPQWALKPALDPTPTDTSFIRDAWNTTDALNRWRDSLRAQGTDSVICGICDQKVGIAYDDWRAHLQTCAPEGTR
jgi:hypothetical protein